MTDQERFNKKMSAIPDEDLIKKVGAWTDRLCTSNGKAWMLTIPPSINDPDMLFYEITKRYEHLKAENQRLREALK